MNETSAKRNDFSDTLVAYLDWRMAKTLLLGFISGFPWVLIGSMVTLWLKEEGLSRTGIGVFGLVFSVYAINALWAPLVDSTRRPPWASVLKLWVVALGALALLYGLSQQLESYESGPIAWLHWTATGLSYLLAFVTGASIAVVVYGTIISRWSWLNRLGRRRSWIVLCQFSIALLALVMSAQRPDTADTGTIITMSLVCLGIAFFSATQDIAVDAMRIEFFGGRESSKLGAAAAMATSGWWAGYGLSGAGALTLVAWLQGQGVEDSWALTYRFLALVPLVCALLLCLFVYENPSTLSGDKVRSLRSPVQTYAAPIASFLRRFGWRFGLALLAAVLLFKVGEAFLGRMSLVFYKEVGFTNEQIALYSKGWGTLAICIFSVLGSFVTIHWGIFRGLVIGGCLMASTNLLFSWLALQPSEGLFLVVVVADQFTTALSTVSFVAFISYLCDRAWTATQYAAFASIGNLARTTLAAGSGFLADALDGDWSVFFIITSLMVLPSLFLLFMLRGKLQQLRPA